MDAASQGFRLEDIGVRFGDTHALSDVSLTIAPGEAVALVGPSGAGKTTLLRLLGGTLRPTTGRVLVGPTDLGTLPPRRLREVRAAIGFIHQALHLVPNLRVSQNVIAGGLGRLGLLASVRALFFPSRTTLRRAFDLLERVGIADRVFERTDRLSGGQQQRVAVARALFQDPRALLADEPVSSVDPARARDTVERLTRISAEERLTLVMSLHNLPLARACFPRLVGLRGGRVVFDRPVEDVGDEAFQALYDLAPDEAHVHGP